MEISWQNLWEVYASLNNEAVGDGRNTEAIEQNFSLSDSIIWCTTSTKPVMFSSTRLHVSN